jgi:hypothetical protein
MEFSGQYLTYSEYKALGGTLDLTPFNILEFEARKEIDKETQGRLINLETHTQETKMCVFELINLKQSINNGVETSGNAINYDTRQISSAVQRIIMKNLLNVRLADGTPYLYRGVI